MKNIHRFFLLQLYVSKKNFVAPEIILDYMWEDVAEWFEQYVPSYMPVLLSTGVAKWLVLKAKEVFSDEDPILQLDAPLVVCGDIHGCLESLLFGVRQGCTTMRNTSATSPAILFLGDVIDRGTHSLECLLILLLAKVTFPKRIYLIRGNHETSLCTQYKFKKTCEPYPNLFQLCLQLFDHLPVAAVIEKTFFCVHGGIPSANRIEVTPSCIDEMLWRDPYPTSSDLQLPGTIVPAFRGLHFAKWNADETRKFLEVNNLKMIIRSHLCVPNGFAWYHDHKVLSIFSVSHYRNSNYAAVLCLYEKKVHVITKEVSTENPSHFVWDWPV